MAHIIGIALTLAFLWGLWRLLQCLPAAAQNVIKVGGGFTLLIVQVAGLAILIGALATEKPSFGLFVIACVSCAVVFVWSAFLSLLVAQRLMLMNLFTGMKRMERETRTSLWQNSRVSWKDYQG
jgi:hypothetical protein